MAPRPQKEAEALANAGHDVTVMGIWFDSMLMERDRALFANKSWRFVPILDFQPIHRWRNQHVRAQTRLAKEIYQRFKRFSPHLLGYGAIAMLKAAREFHADLTIVHSEAGLWIGDQLLDAGYQVGVDFEDWFSEDLLPEARISRPINQLKRLESRLIQDCQYCLTTSNAMADAMAKAYHAPTPTVIYNCFPDQPRSESRIFKDRQNLNLCSLHWFSQTIGPGRGLELLFEALPLLNNPVEIHLRGQYSDSARRWLEPLVPDEWRDRLFIHSTVPTDQLLDRIAEHDIGLALEVPHCPSRQLTITNKLFQYLQAGLAVVATDTLGQQEIFSKVSTIGRLVAHNSSESLAQALNELIRKRGELAIAKATARTAAEQLFNWEHQANQLRAQAERALQN